MSTVLYGQTGRIVTITINRPDAMNAIDPETQEALVAAWTRFRDEDDAWVAILTGAGEKSFCAGADLKKMIPASFGQGARRREHDGLGLGGITRGLEIWKPMIAAINGHCLAGGMEQALACDIRISAILRGLSMSLPDGLRHEAFLSGTLRGTEDAVEGPKAFAEKRKPNFQAR